MPRGLPLLQQLQCRVSGFVQSLESQPLSGLVLGVIWLSAVRWDFTCLTPSEPYRFLAQAICLPAFTDRAMEAWYHSLLHE